MIEAEFQPTLFPSSEAIFTDDPYVRVELYNKDPLNTYFSECYKWEKSSDNLYQYRLGGAEIIGLHGGRNLFSATLTRTFDIQESGKYWVLVRVFRNSTDGEKTLGLEIDGTLKGEISCYSPWNHYKYLDYGFMDIKKGSRTIKLYMNGRNVWVDHILLYKIDTYTSEMRKSKYRLDWGNIEFTENAMGEINASSITVPLREQWKDPNRNPYGGLCFDYYDVMNIVIGNKRRDARVKFGGYLIGYDESDDGEQLTLNGADRLVDLYGRPNYTNYYIGLAPSGEETVFPSLQFASGEEAVRHASETSEYGPMSYGINYPYGFYRDYTLRDYFNTITATGFTKTYSPSTGLMLGYAKLIPDHCGITPDMTCRCTLFSSTASPIDANEHGLMALKYMAAGESCGINSRVQMNIEVTMYKKGQTAANATTYTILFTGKGGASNIIGQIPPVLDSTTQIYKFDLKAAFDRYAPSTRYYITKIELKDVATSEQMRNRQSSTINIMSLMLYNQDSNVKLKLEQDTNYPYENIKEILDKLGYVAWVDYGQERRYDVLCMAPEMYLPSPVKAKQGVNVLAVMDKSYAPYDTVKNRRMSHYHYKEGDTERTALAFAENRDSVIRYGPGAKESYEDQTEINNLTDANIENQKFIEKNSYPMRSFTLKIRETPLLNPSQYIITEIPGEYIKGNYSTKTATHNITIDESYVTIGVNRPDSYYTQIITELEDKLEKYRKEKSRRAYDKTVLANMGFTGIGAFIRSGY